jgi:acetyl esterase
MRPMRAGVVSRRENLEGRVARAAALLSPRAQLRLTRRPPVQIDGQTLAPDLQLALALMARAGTPPLQTLAPPRARELTRVQAAAGAGPRLAVGDVHDLQVDGGAGPLRARHYAPQESGGPHPLLVYFHGGGFVVGDVETHDAPCRLICAHAGVHVLSVDYRLAPEHRFPAAIEDGRAATAWAQTNAASLGADPARVAVGGDSAGANIAAVVAWETARDGAPAPALQLLIYPVTEMRESTPSRERFADGFFLTGAMMDWFGVQYADELSDLDDPRLSILRAPGLGGLAPALVVTAGFDPLRDEGEAYARALEQAGTRVVSRRHASLIHGFINMTGISRSSRDALVELSGTLRGMLAAAR